MKNAPPYMLGNFIPLATVYTPAALLSGYADMNPSTPELPNPVRQIDVLGVTNFFDHAGNCINGAVGAAAVIALGSVINYATTTNEDHLNGYADQSVKRPIIIAGSAALAASSVNAAYEAGIALPAFNKPDELGFDTADTTFGSVTGILYSAVFCATTLVLARKARKKRAATQRA